MQTTFGHRIKLERTRLGLTQENFAALGGVKRVSQCLYEQDTRVPDLHYLQMLVKHGVDVMYLVLGRQATSPLPDQLVIPANLLSDIYTVVDEFGRDIAGKPLPLPERLRLFQFLCAAVAGSHAQENVEELRRKLMLFSPSRNGPMDEPVSGFAPSPQH